MVSSDLTHFTQRARIAPYMTDLPRFISGNLLTTLPSSPPPRPKILANGSSRYPASTALILELDASLSVSRTNLSLSSCVRAACDERSGADVRGLRSERRLGMGVEFGLDI